MVKLVISLVGQSIVANRITADSKEPRDRFEQVVRRLIVSRVIARCLSAHGGTIMEVDACDRREEKWLRVRGCEQTEGISNGKWLDNEAQLPCRNGSAFLGVT